MLRPSPGSTSCTGLTVPKEDGNAQPCSRLVENLLKDSPGGLG